MSKSKTTIPAAADAFLQHTESIRKGIQELLETERRRSDDLQKSVQSLQRQLESAETSRQQLIELITNARSFLSNSQSQLGGLLGAVDSLLSVGSEPMTTTTSTPAPAMSTPPATPSSSVVTAAEMQKEKPMEKAPEKPAEPKPSPGAVSPEEFAARSNPDDSAENRRSWFGRT